MADITDITIHVDPACPWAWLTSRWLAEVEKVRPVRATTRLFVLGEINRDREPSERALRAHSASLVAMHLLVAARRAGGDAALARLFTAIGEAHHERDHALDEPAMLTEALTAAGLDPEQVTRVASDPSIHEELMEEHRAIAARGAFGVPTLVIGEAQPTFGPIVDTRITGEAAGELWDRVSWLIGAGSFFELKRERTRRPEVGRYRMAASAAG
ncbi:MAG: DsbA family protein [Candidatus Dormiibacterota bacterium]